MHAFRGDLGSWFDEVAKRPSHNLPRSRLAEHVGELDQLIENCNRDKIGVLTIYHLQGRGNGDGELVTKLDKLAAAGLALKFGAPTEWAGRLGTDSVDPCRYLLI